MCAVTQRQVPLNHFLPSPSQLNPLRSLAASNCEQAFRWLPVGHQPFAGLGVTLHCLPNFCEVAPQDGGHAASGVHRFNAFSKGAGSQPYRRAAATHCSSRLMSISFRISACAQARANTGSSSNHQWETGNLRDLASRARNSALMRRSS
jgi:hypothetical protein